MISYRSLIISHFFTIGKSDSNKNVLNNHSQKDSDHDENIFGLNNTSSSSTLVTTNDAAETHPIPNDYETSFGSQGESVLSGSDEKYFDYLQHDFIRVPIVHDSACLSLELTYWKHRCVIFQ